MNVGVSIMSVTVRTTGAFKGADGIIKQFDYPQRMPNALISACTEEKIPLPLTAVCTHQFNEIVQALQ